MHECWFMIMAMRHDLNNPLKSSSYKQVKQLNGKYGHMSLQSGISKCDICQKNFQRMKLFDHFKESHRQYFCTVCRARFKIHKDLISHLQDIHQLVASDYLNNAQDKFNCSVNKRYFAQPLRIPQLPILPNINSQFSNSSSEDELFELIDNLDVLDIVLGTKNCNQRRNDLEVGNVMDDIINDVIDDVKAEELFSNTLQDLNCSDLSMTYEPDDKARNNLDVSECETIKSSPQSSNNILSNIVNISEKTVTLCKSPKDKDFKSSQPLHNIDEEFKLEIHSNMSDVLSEKSPWVNGPGTLLNINNSSTNDSDLIIMALTLDHKLTNMKINVILKECIRTSCLTCVYCHNATCIAVNGKQLALHLIEKHRFMTVKNETSVDVVNVLKSCLNSLENIYLNSENFDSTDELNHIPFNNIFYCFNCQFTSKQMKEVNSHKRSVHSRKTYDCIMCKITFSNYGELYCHLCPGADFGISQNLSFRCLFCGQSQIPSAFRCMVHLRKAHNACDYCLETFPNQQSLALHVNKHKMRHMCLKCNITYLSKKDIFEHMFWKHNRDSKECKLCLTKKWPYTYHFCVPPAIFSCDECKRTYSNALLLKVHERWHSGNIPYECNTCHCKFISKKLLKKHEVIHEEIKSPIKKKKRKKKKKGDDYNLPPLNLSSDSDTEKTPRPKPEKNLKSPSPSGNNYWDYVSKQKKELVHIALIDHDYTALSTSQTDLIKSPKYLDELTPIINGNENILNNSFNKSSCSSHCNSSSSSSSCRSNCSCSASCSSSSDSEREQRKKPIIESPKKHKRKKKEKKIKILSAKKIANFNLGALESDLESEFVDTDDEDYYDINPVPLHSEVNTQLKINSPFKQESLHKNKSFPHENNSPLLPRLSIPNDHNIKLCISINKPNQFTNVESQILGNNDIGRSPLNDNKMPSQYDVPSDNSYTFEQNLSSLNENVLPTNCNQESNENSYSKNSVDVYNGKNSLLSVKKELNLSTCLSNKVDESCYTHPCTTIYHGTSLLAKKLKKHKSKIKTIQKNSPLRKTKLSYVKEAFTPSSLSVHSSHYPTYKASLCSNVASSSDTRHSKRQLKKRKFFGYDSSDEEKQIPNGDSTLFQQSSSHRLKTPKKKKPKQKFKIEPPLHPLHYTTTESTHFQQTRPIVDVRISKIVVPPNDDTDSDSGNLVIELPKFIEQKAVQSTERLYCHCRCPYDEVSEMIACDNPNCRVEWFHFDCVGIAVAPKGNWFCPDCR